MSALELEGAWASPDPGPDEDDPALFGAALSPGLFNPVPVVAVNGVDLPSGTAGALTENLIVVDGVSIEWGREEVLDQPEPATGRLVLFDRTGTWASDTDRRGQSVTLRWVCPLPGGGTASAVYFRGRIGDRVTVSRRKVAHPVTGRTVVGSLVEVPLQSILVDLANVVPTAAWPAETMGARFDRVIAAAQAAGVLTGGGTLRAFWRDPGVAAVAAADQVSLLEHLNALYDSAGTDRLSYDPVTDSVSYVLRRDFPGSRTTALLWWDGTDPAKARAGQGVYVLPIGATPIYLDAAALEYDPADGITTPARITRVALAHPDSAAAYATRNIEARVQEEAGGSVNELLAGVRVARLDSLVAWNSYADTALSDLEFLVRREASGWLLEPVKFSSRRAGGFETLAAVQVLLAGREIPQIPNITALVALQRSWLPAYGIRPVFGVMGGRIDYRSGGWEVELRLAPVNTNPMLQHAISWSEFDDGSTTYEVQWWDGDHPRGMHESLTFEDLGHVGRGLNVATPGPDTGWDRTSR